MSMSRHFNRLFVAATTLKTGLYILFTQYHY
jgi:hypothetical protein